MINRWAILLRTSLVVLFSLLSISVSAQSQGVDEQTAARKDIDRDFTTLEPEVARAVLWLNPYSHSSMWGEAVPGSTVTVTTPLGEYNARADPVIGLWEMVNIGMIYPGDEITVMAGAGLQPVEFSIPDPFDAQVDTAGDTVSGQIGGWEEQLVEVHGYWEFGDLEIPSDPDGDFEADYSSYGVDIPRGGRGHVAIKDTVNFTEVEFQRPFYSLDLVLNVNYGHDWVEGFYEPGHTVWIDLTTSDEVTIKGQSELTSRVLPNWEGQPGFSTQADGWEPVRPDIVPGDWVFGDVDNGNESSVHIGAIDGVLDADADSIHGTIFVPGEGELLEATCEIWEEFGPVIHFVVDPGGDSYNCDFSAVGWDLMIDQLVAVTYWDPDGDHVINTFEFPRIYLPLTVRKE
jgi:hypothetical protein